MGSNLAFAANMKRKFQLCFPVFLLLLLACVDGLDDHYRCEWVVNVTMRTTGSQMRFLHVDTEVYEEITPLIPHFNVTPEDEDVVSCVQAKLQTKITNEKLSSLWGDMEQNHSP